MGPPRSRRTGGRRGWCAAEEQQRGDAGDGDHVGVFGHEEHGELHGAVFGVVAGDELGLGFGEVEGRAVGFGIGGHQVDEEGDDLEAAEDVPGAQPWADWSRRCRGGGATGAHDDADQREAEGELVADDLGGGAERAEERVLVVRAPAGERDAVDADGGDAEDDEQADVEVGDLEEVDAAVQWSCAPKGTTAMETSAQPSAMMGASDEERALDGEGHHVFLEEELDAVGERLEEAEGADARGSPAVLHAAEDLALEQHGVGDGRERDDEHHSDLDDR